MLLDKVLFQVYNNDNKPSCTRVCKWFKTKRMFYPLELIRCVFDNSNKGMFFLIYFAIKTYAVVAH